MTRRSARSGFTLIELMVVLAIIAIMATMAWSLTAGNRPKMNLVAEAGDVRLELIRARTLAIRGGRPVTVCLFRDDDLSDTTPLGRIVSFQCGSTGAAGCSANALQCENDQYVVGADNWTVASVNCADANKWCKVTDIDLGGADRAPKKVSISRFTNWGAAPVGVGDEAIRITYLPTGYVDATRSNPGSNPAEPLTAGGIELVNREMCADPCVDGTSYAQRIRLEYVAGGGTSIE